MPVDCQRCGSAFSDQAHLARHMGRQNPCGGGCFRCGCGRSYAHRSSLGRHRRGCASQGGENQPRYKSTKFLEEPKTKERDEGGDEKDAPTPHITINNIGVQGSVNVTNILAMGDVVAPLPGWPAKWPIYAAPRPFHAPNIAITLDTLRRAVRDVRDVAACLRGDPAAVANLLVKIIREIHANPRQRNIYLNPNRADQVLVYVPERWEVLTLLDGIRLTLGHVAKELATAPPLDDAHLLGLAQVAGKEFREQPGAIVKSSRGAMVAHLASLRLQPQSSGASWLGEPDEGEPVQLREFGREGYGHLTPDHILAALERDLGIYSAPDYEAKDEATTARFALVVVARMVLYGHPENLTAVMLSEQDTMVRGADGWEICPTSLAAAKLARSTAKLAAAFIRLHVEGPNFGGPEIWSHWRPLAAYLDRNADELAAGEAASPEILAQYSHAAERHCARTTDPELKALGTLVAEGRHARAQICA